MAEAAVEDRPLSRFYCHMCNVQFESSSANFTCPHCSDGFVEQLESGTQSGNVADEVYLSDSDEDSLQMNLGGLDFLFPAESRTASSGRPSFSVTTDPARRRRTLHRLASSNLRQHTPFENLIQDFIVNLGVGVNWGGSGNMQLFLGNPGDYAWGREGLDAIVTQLLNQMDTSGPPPLAKDIIDAIPSVEVSQEQVASKLQCSVCWEDFQLNEKVRQLACQHVYHEPCIRPWLELHGTCPICRQDLGNEEHTTQANPQANNTAGNTYNTLQQLFQAVQNSGNSVNNSGATSTSNSDTTSSSSNSESMN